MAAVNITRKPSERVADLVRPTRQGYNITSNWKTNWWSTDDNNPARFEGVDAWFIFNASWYKPKTTVESRSWQRYVTADVVWVRDAEMATEFTQAFNRSKYHPLTPGRYLESVSVQAAGWNKRGFGPKVGQTYAFYPPRPPRLEVPEVDQDTGRIKCEITPAKGDDAWERYDTQYVIMRQDSANRDNAYRNAQIITRVGGKAQWATTTTGEPFEPAYDVGDRATIRTNEWIKITFKAISRGVRGNSAVAERSHVFAYPSLATITGITYNDLAPSGLLTVAIRTNYSEYRPVDEVKLQILKDSDATTAAEAGFSQGWEDLDYAVDEATCSGFSVPVYDAMPERGTHTWFRPVTRRDTLTVVGHAVEAAMLFKEAPTAEDDSVTVHSATSGADGESLVVVLGWDDDDSTGTEVSWSAKGDAWQSTEPPSTYQVTWEDDEPQVPGRDRSATLVIRGLEEGVPVYVKARRYLEQESGTSYGGYSTPVAAQFPAVPATRPNGVALDAPAYVTRGSDIPVTWTYSGGEQTAWALYSMPGRTVIANGEGTAGAYSIPADYIGSRESVTVMASVTTGGEWSDSASAEVAIADAPSVTLEVGSELTAQPVTATVGSDTAEAGLVMVLYADGVTRGTPSGSEVQAEGDVLWSAMLDPDWEESDGSYAAEVVLPTGLPLVNDAAYTLTAKAVDSVTGLSSDVAEGGFAVSWSHTAGVPSGTVAVDADLKRARITVTAPDGAAEGDVCDVYRKTPDGAYLVAGDVAFGSTVIDRYAPYGNVELYYRVATRTTDGDTEFTDLPYALKGGGMRFDWATRSLSLPFNVEHSDSWSKDFEERQHLDGSVAGRWNPAVSRRVSLSSDMVGRLGAADMELLRELAQYPGSVFVRLSNGCAFEANVDVDEMRGSGSAAVPVSLTATEVDLTEEFMVPLDGVVPEGSDHSGYGD